MERTRAGWASAARASARERTRVVLPTPWTPLRPMRKGRALSGPSAARWSARCSRMKGMQIGDLSSRMAAMVGLILTVWQNSRLQVGCAREDWESFRTCE
ncbi:predicted protein [Verticillium alfalfae VaMs.102]|uniref:Predicted protein n=1 Tax=Verticillium alfalfae (strain VaMs.102 / ATCC MYA-4576 / FGSC 10136) TaxID=526221 RepID=C9S793_VERA1|nr:predicted protein [Verticillium alfalfae VaMs.102]EEY14678.1 predicted protein [Verticillium alfalfae VaMs.102]